MGTPLTGTGRVSAGLLPEARYISLIYTGFGLSRNKALVEWARASNLPFERCDNPKGDAFRCRYVSFPTDPKTEPRKTRGEVEVAIKLADNLLPTTASR